MSDAIRINGTTYRDRGPQPAVSQRLRDSPERAEMRAVRTIVPDDRHLAFVQPPVTPLRYSEGLVIAFRGRNYYQDPDHEHEPVGDAGAYALVWRFGRTLWRGYSDGWEAIREVDAVQSYAFETGGIAECSPEAVVDADGLVRWLAP